MNQSGIPHLATGMLTRSYLDAAAGRAGHPVSTSATAPTLQGHPVSTSATAPTLPLASSPRARGRPAASARDVESAVPLTGRRASPAQKSNSRAGASASGRRGSSTPRAPATPSKGADSVKRGAPSSPPDQKSKKGAKQTGPKSVKKGLSFDATVPPASATSAVGGAPRFDGDGAPGDGPSNPMVVHRGAEDATLATLFGAGLVTALFLSELKDNNHFGSESVCVLALGCLFTGHARNDCAMCMRGVALRRCGAADFPLFLAGGQPVAPFTLADAPEGDEGRSAYVAMLCRDDSSSANLDDIIRVSDMIEQIISMSVAAVLSLGERTMRCNARAVMMGNQLLVARLGNGRGGASETGADAGDGLIVKFSVDEYALLAHQAGKILYIDPSKLALDTVAMAMSGPLRGENALLPEHVPRASVAIIQSKQRLDGTKQDDEQEGFYVGEGGSSVNVMNMSTVVTQRLTTAAVRDSKEEVLRKSSTLIRTVYVLVFDLQDEGRWRFESVVMQHFEALISELAHQSCVSALLLRRVVEQALHIVSMKHVSICVVQELKRGLFYYSYVFSTQAARFLAVPAPDRAARTISDAINQAIDRLRTKLHDYALGGGSQMAMVGPSNVPYPQAAPVLPYAGQQRQAVVQSRQVKAPLPRLLGGMGSGAPQCTISVHDPSKGGDGMKWCAYDHTSFGQPQPTAASVAAATTLAAQGGARGLSSVRGGARRTNGAHKKKK